MAAGFKLEGVTFLAGDAVLGHVSMRSIPSAYNYALTIPQSETERLLEERLAGQGIAVERDTEATALTLAPDGVTTILRHADGTEETLRTPWLVGCDGAHSTVRHAVGAAFAGETNDSDWFLADIHMTGYPRPETDASIHWHRDGVLIIFPMGAGRYRLIGDLPHTDAAAPATPTLEQVQALTDRRGPQGTKLLDPVWLAGFRINGRKVAAYRHGRAFLAGDAAHIHSPAGGQGMNTGMQDAFNLAWKLALVTQGTAADHLLDSYSPERSAVGDQVLKAAARLTSVATLRNPLAQTLRNLAAPLLLGLPAVTHEVAETMSEVAIHYPDSPLNGPSDHGLRPAAGERLPPIAGEPQPGAGTMPCFALHAAASPAVAGLLGRHAALVDAEVRAPLKEGGIWLVRPDGYVACATRNLAAVAAYLDGIAG